MALHIVGLVKSLPEAEQQEVRAALASQVARRPLANGVISNACPMVHS